MTRRAAARPARTRPTPRREPGGLNLPEGTGLSAYASDFRCKRGVLGSGAVWMLLDRLRKARFLQTVESTAGYAVPQPAPPVPEPAPPQPLTLNGTHATEPATDQADETVIKLYLHPGRTLIGEVALDQLYTQFDVDAAGRYPNLESAETACGDRSAFLADVKGPLNGESKDPARPAGVALLIRGLRP